MFWKEKVWRILQGAPCPKCNNLKKLDLTKGSMRYFHKIKRMASYHDGSNDCAFCGYTIHKKNITW